MFGARAAWIATGQATQSLGNAHALSLPGSAVPAISEPTRAFIRTPRLDGSLVLPDGQTGAAFNTIPGRPYTLESSIDLKRWTPIGIVQAKTFAAELPFSPHPSTPPAPPRSSSA